VPVAPSWVERGYLRLGLEASLAADVRTGRSVMGGAGAVIVGVGFQPARWFRARLDVHAGRSSLGRFELQLDLVPEFAIPVGRREHFTLAPLVTVAHASTFRTGGGLQFGFDVELSAEERRRAVFNVRGVVQSDQRVVAALVSFNASLEFSP
jgi:hypothetical protein